jgi:hydrogenase-4 component B
MPFSIPELLLVSILALFLFASLFGIFSKKASLALGALASAFTAGTSLLVILENVNVTFVLWSIMSTSSAEISFSPFNGYFLLISSLVWLGTCVYSLKYDDDYPNSLSSLLLLTMLSMVVILLSGDAVLFLIGWESMTLSSFFMILDGKGNRKGVLNAAFIFLAFGEGSTVFVMLSFAGMFSSVQSLDFLSTTTNSIIASGPIASWVFLASLVGFGLKMGIAPFHMSEWLPIAHSSAPSNASALLSATLTLMGVYGLIDVVSHLGTYQLWWGWVALTIGGISAMLGALFASASEHSKGLPAYSTIENNGLIIVSIGAYILSSYYHLALLADLALIAALFHAFAHSISKGSLFLLMGWISKIKNSFDLNKIGATISIGRKATYVTGLFTVLSLLAAPPLAGFVSEWMILEVLFQSFRYGDVTSQIVGTLVGAFSALAAGIIIVAMTKAYGYGILWSEKNPLGPLQNSGEENVTKRSSFEISSSLIYFGVLIVGIGIAAPAIFLLGSNALASTLGNNAFQNLVSSAGPVIYANHFGAPLYFVILSGNPFGGFSPTFTAFFMVGLLVVPFLISFMGSHWQIRRAPGWFAGQSQPNTSNEIYSSFGYSTPIRLMLRFLFRTKENVTQIGGVKKTQLMSPEEYFVELEVLDVFKRFYDVLGRWTLSFSSIVGRKFMPGHLSNYLIYIIIALVFVMLYVFVTVL